MSVRLLTAAVAAALFLTSPLYSVALEELETGEGKIYRLSNELLEVDILPATGGRIVRLFDKGSGQELTRAAAGSLAPAGSGLLNDRVIEEGRAHLRHYESAPYTVINVKAEGITMSCDGKPLKIEKTIRLEDGKRLIRVDYAISNSTAKDFTGRYWSCGVLAPPAKNGYRLVFPFGKPSSDIREYSGKAQENECMFNPSAPVMKNWFINQPEHDYAAVLGDRVGAAIIAPFPVLERFYSFHPSASSQSLMLPTAEWFSLPFLLKPLATGQAEAINHPELADPLQDYIYRFTMYVDVFETAGFNRDGYRPKSNKPKSERFKPQQENAPVYREFTTPAILWLARPDKPLKLLAVVNANSSPEMFEFSRRINTDLSLVEVAHPHVFKSYPYFGWKVPEPEPLLDKELDANPPVILLSGTTESSLPSALFAKLKSKIEAGAVLIYIADANRMPGLIPEHGSTAIPSWISNGIPLDKLPAKISAVEYPLGKGKIIHVKCRLIKNGLLWTQESALTPYMDEPGCGSLPYWEYYFAWYGKLLRYAAGETPEARIDMAAVDSSVKLKITTGKPLKNAEIQIIMDSPVARDSHRESWQGGLKAGENEITIPCPEKKMTLNGDYYFNIILKGHDWYTAVRNVQTPDRIDSLKTASYAHRANEPVKGTVELSGSGELVLELRDTAGRLLGREQQKNARGKVEFSIPVQGTPVTPLATLRASLNETSQANVTVTIEPRSRPALNFSVWTHTGTNWFAGFQNRIINALGFTAAMGGNFQVRTSEEIRRLGEISMGNGMRYSPMTMHRISVGSKSLSEPVRNPCMRDPAYHRKIVNDVRQTVEKASSLFPYAYYSGDENSLGYYGAAHDLCQSSFCLEAFSRAMKSKYGDIAKLNRIWQSNYRDWSEIKPPKLGEVKNDGQAAAWFEHRLFMMDAIPGAFRTMKSSLNEVSPGARLGFSGQLITDINACFNWLEVLKSVDEPIAYLRVDDGLPDLIRSYRTASAKAGGWVGYNSTLDAVRWSFWNQVVNGMFSPSYWWSGYFLRRGDSLPNESGVHMKKLIAEIRESGADKIFAEAEFQPSPVAVVYSLPSLVMSGVTGRQTVLSPTTYTNNYHGWTGLIRDLGFQPPEIVGCDQLAGITPGRYPILVLPLTLVLGDRAVAGLKHYVDEGGTLVIDAMAGTYDDFGYLRPANPFAEMAKLQITPPRSADTSGSLEINGQNLRVMLTGSIVKTTGSPAAAEIRTNTRPVKFGQMEISAAPGIISQAVINAGYGKGKIIYLNFLLADYPETRLRSVSGEPLRKALRDLPGSRHQLPLGSSVVEYRAHGNRYIGMTRGMSDGNDRTTLELGGKYHVYDTLKHQYLGKLGSIDFEIGRNDVRTFALLPEKIAPLTGTANFDGRVFNVKLSSPAAATVIRVTVAVNGIGQPHYAANHVISDINTVVIDPGLEATRGNWEFRITDLFSGQTIKQTVEVK